ncbi:MAG: pyocin knob domain-containing protein [Oscillospiraceae bacterium]
MANQILSTVVGGKLTSRLHSAVLNHNALVDVVFKGYGEVYKYTFTGSTLSIGTGAGTVGGRVIENDQIVNTQITSNYYFRVLREVNLGAKTASLIIQQQASSSFAPLITTDLQSNPSGIRQDLLYNGRNINGVLSVTSDYIIAKSRNMNDVIADVDKSKNDLSGKVSKTGDTMSGALTLPAVNPTNSYQAAHKAYVDLGQRHKLTQDSGWLWEGSSAKSNDYNLQTTTGFYYMWGNALNRPTPDNQPAFVTITKYNTVIVQSAFMFDTGETYVRRNAGGWFPWVRLLTHEDNVDKVVYLNYTGLSSKGDIGTEIYIGVDLLEYEEVLLEIARGTAYFQLEGSVSEQGYAECSVTYRGLESEIYTQVTRVARTSATTIRLNRGKETVVVNGGATIFRDMSNITKVALLGKKVL